MTGLSTWWRKTGSLLAALVLAVLTVGPSFDALICQGEAPSAASAAIHADAAQAHSDAGHADEPGACLHGHCHHAAPYVPVLAAAVGAPDAVRERRAIVLTSAAASDRQFGLERPPRA